MDRQIDPPPSTHRPLIAGPVGLTATEVAERRRTGRVNTTSNPNRRTLADIARANILTRFNAILGSLLVVVLVIGDYRDALFGIVLVTNAVVGIAQEIRAKRTLDRLDLVASPLVKVIRGGRAQSVVAADVVLDDVLLIERGDHVPVDGVVLEADNLEIDESLLTGEADPIHRDVHHQVRSGSFVVAGRGHVQATAVGDDAFAARLANEAKRFALTHSELRAGTDKILQVGTLFLVPTAALLVASQLRTTTSLVVAVTGSVAGIAAAIPEGLVLLTSVAFAVGVIRLGKRQALVQELAAVEVLARVDVVCIDKTGTLTEGALHAGNLEILDPHRAESEIREGLGALVANEAHPNPSLTAVAALGLPATSAITGGVLFSSARRWSAVTVDGSTWLLGAPDVLLEADDPVRSRTDAIAASGSRVLLIAHSPEPLVGDALPSSRRAAALICLNERIRPDAQATLDYFRREGITVKVISGDHPQTVGHVAQEVGIPAADAPVDGRDLPTESGALAQMMEERSVFGRVQPHQKREMVAALQSRGHVVAMTGDGVNDVLALKEADLGVAMGSGTGAARAVAQVILLDDSFASLPAVLGEGRRVIGNIERVANLFVTKSVYALLLSIAVGVAQLPFPFFPRHLTIISTLTIGIPGFFLALAPNEERARPGFVSRVSHFAIPAGAVAAAATFGAYYLARQEPDISLVAERTTSVIVLFLVAGWVLMILARPLSSARVTLLAAMGLAFLVAMSVPWLQEFFALELPQVLVVFAAIGIAAIAIALLEVGWQLVEWRRRRTDLRALRSD